MNDRVERVARAAHEANRAYCQNIGDNSQPAWEDAPDWQRDSVRAGVQAIIDNPATTPEQSHEGWLAQKEADGWKYGAVKDVDKKEHPCFVPYDELPPEQREKDNIFGRVVRASLAASASIEDEGKAAGVAAELTEMADGAEADK